MNNKKINTISQLNALIGYTLGVILIERFLSKSWDKLYWIIIFIVVMGMIIHASVLLGFRLPFFFRSNIPIYSQFFITVLLIILLILTRLY